MVDWYSIDTAINFLNVGSPHFKFYTSEKFNPLFADHFIMLLLFSCQCQEEIKISVN